MEGYTIDLVLDKAMKMVKEAATFCDADREAALSEVSNPHGRFVEGDRYVFVLDSNGLMLAHGFNQNYVGQDFYPITDIDGKMFIKEIVDSANDKGYGWTEYKWLDPATKTEQPKTVYFEKTNGLIICSGSYGAHPASSILENPPHQDDIPLSEAYFSSPGTAVNDATEETDAPSHGAELIPDDAKCLVEKAITFYKANNKGTALAEFSNPQGIFVKGEQYVFVLDASGVMLAHGVNRDYVGKDFYQIADTDGKMFIKEIVDCANDRGSGWTEYKWLDPVSKAEQPKTVYFEKTNGVIICSGIYRY
jgi:signal transduction histidine kinase